MIIVNLDVMLAKRKMSSRRACRKNWNYSSELIYFKNK